MTESEVKDRLEQTGAVITDLVAINGKVVGHAIKRSVEVRQPVYVSVGHKVSLDTACDIVHRCCSHRIPEPIRQPDMLVRTLARTALS